MSKNNKLEEKIAKMSFEAALARLEEVVEILSSQNSSLEQMIDLYHEGDLLKKHCSTRLQEAKMKLEIVEKD